MLGGTIVVAAVLVVLAGDHPGGHGSALDRLTREGGPFELGTAILLALGAALAARRAPPWGWAALGGVLLIAAGEELSWGQHQLGFEPGAFFETHNLQGETNLHNLIPAPVFNTLLYVPLYAFFVLWPSWVDLSLGGRREALPRWLDPPVPLPPLGASLAFTFGATLHAYFRPITASDTAFAWAAIGLVAVRLRRQGSARHLAHGLLLAATACASALYALHHEVLTFQNRQYEIREMVIALAICLWLADAPPARGRRGSPSAAASRSPSLPS